MATAVKRQPKIRGKATFRLLTGCHLDRGPEGCECPGCSSDNPKLAGSNHMYESYETYVSQWKRSHPKGAEPPSPNVYDNDLVESEEDLDERFNAGPHSRKFERLGGASSMPEGPITQEELTRRGMAPEPFVSDQRTDLPDLEMMTIPQLRELAANEEIDLGSTTRKDDIIAAIRAAV